MVYCSICGTWIKAKTYGEAERQHFHRGITGGLMKAEPVDYTSPEGELAIKPVYNFLKWRAYAIEVVTGYSDHPVFGHEAGGCIHYLYRALRDGNGKPVEALTKDEIVIALSNMEGVSKGNHLFGIDLHWQDRYPLVEVKLESKI